MKPGYYWVKVSGIVADSGGIIDQPMGEPEIARWDGLHWFRTGVGGILADQFEVLVLSREPLGLENSEEHAARELERSHAETEFWYETAFKLVQKLARHPGLNFAEQALRFCERRFCQGDGDDAGRDATKWLLDDYRQRMQRWMREAEVEFARGVGEKIRSDLSTRRRYPLGVEVKVQEKDDA